jgi:transglutaminase-like putative cysteine protease
LLVAPWALALGGRFSVGDAWEGAVVLVVGVLWFCDERRAVLVGLVAALPSIAVAGSLRPPVNWLGLGVSRTGTPAFETLDVVPTYGPLIERRMGATMLTITAPAPALWRMQTLDYASGSWSVAGPGLPDLPQPAAKPESVSVRVVGLDQGLVAAPGRIVRVRGAGRATRTDGEGVVLTPAPPAGRTYRVEALIVHATAVQLSGDRARLDPRARAYTRVEDPVGPSFSGPFPAWLLEALEAMPSSLKENALAPGVVALARRLARGRPTEWEIVTRVVRYLDGGGRFRYTTDVPTAGAQPLVDFLLRTHAGYCQQFAGAAALLLRLAGVPARVVAGFATGKQIAPDRYDVRDLDAHEWIEVYFGGYGWVPFNPTPAADPVQVAGAVDPLAPAPTSAPHGGADYPLAPVLGAVAIGLAWPLLRRRGRRTRHDCLDAVARRVAGPVGPSTTLVQLRSLLAARIGPRTAAIAEDMNRAQFGPGPSTRMKHPRLRVVLAVLCDLGLFRSAGFWARPAGRSGRTHGAGQLPRTTTGVRANPPGE